MILGFMNIAGRLSWLPLVLALTQCDRIDAMMKPKAKEPGPYAFDITLKVSPKGEAALKQAPDGLFVDAWYYGQAAPGYRGQADRLNRIYLGDERSNYPATVRRIHLKGEAIDASKLSQTSDGQPMVLLSVGGGGTLDNPLSCHDYIGQVRHAQQRPPVLYCEFDTEHYWARAGSEASAQ
jgi:hypothetical protein